MSPTLARNCLGHGLRVTGDSQVEVGDLATQRRVPHGAPDYPGGLRLGSQRSPCQVNEGRSEEAIGKRHSKTARGTLAEIPQVTS